MVVAGVTGDVLALAVLAVMTRMGREGKGVYLMGTWIKRRLARAPYGSCRLINRGVLLLKV